MKQTLILVLASLLSCALPAPNQKQQPPYPWVEATEKGDLKVIIVGDVNVQDRKDPAQAFGNVRATLAAADLRYANLEGLYGQTQKAPIKRKAQWRHSHPSMVKALIAGGFDVVGNANNVTFGQKAILETLGLLDKHKILHCGAGANRAEARAPAIIERNGTRFGFLQYTARYYGKKQIATETSAGVARVDPRVPGEIEEAAADVAALRGKVDVLIFSHHLRKSGSTKTEKYQRTLARAVIEAGADFVFGHGGHVNQGIEVIQGVPVVHCLSNFAFDWWKMKDRNDGLVLRLIVRNKKIVRLSIVPVSRDKDNNVFLTPPASKEGARQLKDLRKLSPGVDLHIEGQEIVVPLN